MIFGVLALDRLVMVAGTIAVGVVIAASCSLVQLGWLSHILLIWATKASY